MPTGITCCDEEKIRLAMTEEALARILAKTEPGLSRNGSGSDYLSDQAYEMIKKRLPDEGGKDGRLVLLRRMLLQPPADRDIEEFQTLVGHFVLGMTLEIGITMQDEFDQAQQVVEKTAKLLARLEKIPRLNEEELGRALFQVDLTERELKRIRASDRKWKEPRPGRRPVQGIQHLEKKHHRPGPRPEQWLVFELAEKYNSRFPFLDEFLENYRRRAAAFRDITRRVNELLSIFRE